MTQTLTFIKPGLAPWAREHAGLGPRETSSAESMLDGYFIGSTS